MTQQATKFFVIGTEGATTDGRTIDRTWLEQAAKNYDPKKYNCRLNLEHLKGILPDGPFKRYGDVVALKTEERDGKLVLLAQVDPTPELVALTKARQKIHTSMEIDPNFADTGAAYLVGLAITDDPASLGTDMLTFCSKAATHPLASRKFNARNIFSAAAEAAIEFEAAPEENRSLVVDFFREIFGADAGGNTSAPAPAPTVEKHAADAEKDALFAAQKQALLFMAQEVDNVSKAITKLADAQKATADDLAKLTTALSSTSQGDVTRPVITGSAGYESQDF